MTIIHLTEHNTKCYGVTYQNNGNIKVQKLEDTFSNKNKIYCVKPLESFVVKSHVCDKTMMSRAFDKSVFDRITILLKINEEIIDIDLFKLEVI